MKTGRWNYVWMVFLCFTLVVACSSSGTSTNHTPSVRHSENGNADGQDGEEVHLTIWSHFSGGITENIEAFQKKYPHVHFELEVFPYNEYSEIYLDALMKDEVPDIMVINNFHFGQFTAIDALEDLTKAPYHADQYRDDFSETLWYNQFPFTGDKIVGLPVSTSPHVTYYRADILEQYGFPTEPEELAEYMKDPENWLNIARTLRKDDIWINQWASDATFIFASQTGLFDKELNFQRSSDEFALAFDISKRVQQEGLASYIDMWIELGQEAIRNGKLAMVYMGSTGALQLQEWAPETAGLWRVTRLPFGINGWSGATIVSIPSASPNKEWAWKFIEFFVFESAMVGSHIDTIPAYLPARKKTKDLAATMDFLGGQKAYAFYDQLVDEMVEYPITPLDAKAYQIWTQTINLGIDRDMDTEDVMRRLDEQIEKQLGKQREILLEQLTGE